MSQSTTDVEASVKKSNFSIEHILNHAGPKTEENLEKMQNFVTFSWLNCTRYCPPKLPRSQKKEGPQKRQLGRHPRIPFSSQQLQVLEEKFKHSPYLSSTEVTRLSRTLELADIRVKIWFQNRRARERRERLDDTPFSPKTKMLQTNPPKINYYAQNSTYSKFNNTIPQPTNYYSSLPVENTNLKNIKYFLDK